jgi:hypothetical protein
MRTGAIGRAVLNLVVAAIILWNTVTCTAIDYLRSPGITPKPIDPVHLSALALGPHQPLRG